MSRDIRSFFTVLPKKGSNPPPKSKHSAKALIQSDAEDVIPETPPQREKNVPSKKRKIQTISSDSEEEKDHKPKTHKQKKKDDSQKKTLKPCNNLKDAFGSTPVKQKKIETKKPQVEEQAGISELKVHDDPAFEKTLLDLDDDLLEQNADILDKTIEEALARNGASSKSNDSLTVDTPNRKRKHSEGDDTVDNDQDRYEKKRHSAILYQKYLQRGGPKHHGSKEVPKGKPDCLKTFTFMRTGVLDSLESDEFEAAVKEHGGRVVHAVSKKVNYVVIGDEPGPAKLEKAKNYGIPTITEDEFLDMIRTKSGLQPVYTQKEVENENGTERKEMITEHPNRNEKTKKSPSKGDPTHTVVAKKSTTKEKTIDSKAVSSKRSVFSNADFNNVKPETRVSEKKEKELPSKDSPSIEQRINKPLEGNISWTEKYKPKDLKGIIGQQGEKSLMNKLLNWLKIWYKYHNGKGRPTVARPSPWAKDDDGAYYKCALLSGPPGVGKTTTATLVAQALGFDIVEFNASDTRSKKLLREEVAQLLSSTSLANFATKGTAVSNKRVLLMDEVDGMAGNEDRGGIQELIALIKNTQVPVICMCNDRNHQKMRSLVNYCYDLRFSKPRLEQIKGAMMSVCFKEGVKISPDALTQIINGTGMDIRQTLNNLSMWTAAKQTLTTEQAEKNANSAKKDTVLGPWEVVRKVFSAEDHKKMSLADKSRLFFFDYSIGPLFVQQNYLKVIPNSPKIEFLLRASKTADSISLSDVIDAKIRGSNNWALLETQAFFASVFPGYYMEGHIGGQINFPAWLGKNSKRSKYHRLMNEIQSHTRVNISGGRLAMGLDYLPYLRNKIVNPMIKEGVSGVEKSLETMKSYNLLREDLDGIVELTHWCGQKDVMSLIDSKVKSAFTRIYNKTAPTIPFAAHTITNKRKATSQDYLYGEEDDEYVESDVDNNDDIEKDALIKLKKTTSRTSKKDDSGKVPKKASSSRGKAKKGK